MKLSQVMGKAKMAVTSKKQPGQFQFKGGKAKPVKHNVVKPGTSIKL